MEFDIIDLSTHDPSPASEATSLVNLTRASKINPIPIGLSYSIT